MVIWTTKNNDLVYEFKGEGCHRTATSQAGADPGVYTKPGLGHGPGHGPGHGLPYGSPKFVILPILKENSSYVPRKQALKSLERSRDGRHVF